MISKLKKAYSSISPETKSMQWFSVCGVFQIAVSSLTTPIFSRMMSTAEYGQFSVYTSWFTVLTIFVTLNINGTVGNIGLNSYREDKRRFIASAQGLGSISLLIFFGFFLAGNEWISHIIGLPVGIICLMFLHMLMYQAGELWMTDLRFEFKYKTAVCFTFAFTVLYTIAGILAVGFSTEKGIAKIVSYAFVQIAMYGIIYIMNFYKAGTKNGITKYWGFVFRHSTRLIPHSLANQILARSDILMIHYFTGPSSAGIYSLGYSLGSIISAFTGSMNSSLMPWLFERMRNRETKAIKCYTAKIILGALMLNIILMLIVPEVIGFFASSDYYDAVYIVPPILSAFFFLFLYSLFVNIEIFYSKTSFMAVISPVVAAVNIILNAVCIPQIGYFMGAYTTLFSYMLYSVLHFWKMRKLLSEEYGENAVYDTKVIVFASIFQLLTMGAALVLYSIPGVRYLVILFILVLMWIYRKKLWEVLRSGTDKN